MNVTSEVSVLFIVVLVGMICRRRGFLTDEVLHGITQLVIYITAPCLQLYNMQRDFSQEVFSGFLLTLLLTIVFILCCIGLGWVLFRSRPRPRRVALSNLIAFSNCGFMGYPIILAINPDWMIYAVAYNIGFTMVCWTVGVSLFGGKGSASLKRALLNPNVVSAVIGFAMFCLRLRWPAVISEALGLLGGLTTPMTMLLIGTRVYGIHSRDLRDMDYHISALLRLVILPFAVLLLTAPLHLAAPVRGTLFLLTAMPMGTMMAMQAELYGGDVIFCARASAWSTLLSMATIPLMALCL